jgi:hypothetical protein
MATPPPPKRTRLSIPPELQGSHTAPATPAGLRAPPRRGSLSPRKTPASAGRASYLSPTKASLARFNPGLLPARTSARGILGSPRRPRTSDGASGLGLGRVERAADLILSSDEPTQRVEEGEDAVQSSTSRELLERANIRRQSEGAVVGARAEESASGPADGTAPSMPVAPIYQPPVRPVNPAPGSTPGRLAPSAMPRDEDDEDEDGLPETPASVRMAMAAQDTPPRGVLFSSPAKRKRKSMGGPASSSPKVRAAAGSRLRERTGAADGPGEPDELSPEAEKRPIEKQPAERPLPEDPAVVAKRKEKEALEKELRELQANVEHFEHQIAYVPSSGTDDAEASNLL